MDISHVILSVILTLALVAANGYFVAAEFAAVSARYARLQIEARTSFLARMALRVKDSLGYYLSSCQFGITLASLGLGAVLQPFVAEMLLPLFQLMHLADGKAHVLAFAFALAIATTLHIVVGEQAPKTWSVNFADTVLPTLALPLVIFTFIFHPFIWCLNWASNSVLKISGSKMEEAHTQPHTNLELRGLLSQAVEAGAIEPQQADLLSSAFAFGSLKVRQVMTPRTEVAFLPIDRDITEVLKIVQTGGFTRYPLCEGDIDHIVGLIHMKDLFDHLHLVAGKLRIPDQDAVNGERTLEPNQPGGGMHVIGAGAVDLNRVKRDIMFVPELQSLPSLLQQFQARRAQFAVVVDEYGATQGIITMEDIVEQLVGEIEDEFDTLSPSDFIVEGNTYRVSGKYALHNLRDHLQLPEDIDFGNVDTVGGFVIRELQRFPKIGDTVRLGRWQLRVVMMLQKQRVGQVLIRPSMAEARDEG